MRLEGFVSHELAIGASTLRLLQPEDAAELPDDGPVEWAPLVPYWSVLWRSGVALARALPEDMRGLRVIELGCGLAVPSLAAARAGAEVLATDFEPEALELLEVNSGNNGVRVATALLEWGEARNLGRDFDLVLAADVLYERQSVGLLLDLLPQLAPEAWIADPGRAPAAAFFDQVRMPVRRITP